MTARVRHRAAGLLAVVSVGIGLVCSGCTSPKDALGPTASRCFRALPVAKGVLSPRARLLGVRLSSGPGLERDLRGAHLRIGLPKAVEEARSLCLVGFAGDFARDRIRSRAVLGAPGGHLALVAVRQRSDTIAVAIVLERTPTGFPFGR